MRHLVSLRYPGIATYRDDATGRTTEKRVTLSDLMRPNPMPRKTYSAFGKEMTVLELSQIGGINTNTIELRIKRGMPPEEAATKPIGRMGPPTVTYLVGDGLMTAAEITAEFGVSSKTFLGRMRDGMGAEEAATTPVPGVRRYMVYGESLTLAEMARKFRLPYHTIRSRLLVGMSPEEAVL